MGISSPASSPRLIRSAQRFTQFRQITTGSSSGSQSVQFRAIEAVSGLRDPHFLQAITEHGAVPPLVQRALARPTLQALFESLLARHQVTIEDVYTSDAHTTLLLLAEGLLEYEQGFARWRFLHVQLVERIIGPATGGTGGTLGAKYLQKTISQRFFPNLAWAVRAKFYGEIEVAPAEAREEPPRDARASRHHRLSRRARTPCPWEHTLHLGGIEIVSPFVLRSVDPPLAATAGQTVRATRRIGKRIVLVLDDDLFIVIHLMVAGRFKWFPKTPKLNRRLALAAFEFDSGTLVLTEAGTKRRASINIVRGEDALRAFDRGGIEPLDATLEAFAARLRSENHTVKRALADPRLFSGIGNAYSDEILHRARLSPMTLTSRMTDEQVAGLFAATRETLATWIARLRADAQDGFPEKVTAFRADMAVHGRFREPCPACGTPVQRIRYADNETNYCPQCQTGGKLLADRALSRLLKEDWPRSMDELDELFVRGEQTSPQITQKHADNDRR